MAVHEPYDNASPVFSVRPYTDQIYKVVYYKHGYPERRGIHRDSSAFQHYDDKLQSSICRAKSRILELALCNDWSYFCTFTIDKNKYDRHNLAVFYKDFSQFIRDLRKKTGKSFRYVFVPELHDDGAWHIHGLMDDSPDVVSFIEMYSNGINVPYKLVKGGYFNWYAFEDRFGFCSLGRIRDPVACAFYVTKYISKSIAESVIPLGGKLYYCSQGLNRSGDPRFIYRYSEYFHQFCNEHEFVDSGFTCVQDGCDWTFGLDPMDVTALDFDDPDIDEYIQDMEVGICQLSMDGF